ncbi:MAG: hypothetical protein FK732_12930 [Asgard group archaeon]|nr:hypothetical protein [Asgard group archaeon]
MKIKDSPNNNFKITDYLDINPKSLESIKTKRQRQVTIKIMRLLAKVIRLRFQLGNQEVVSQFDFLRYIRATVHHLEKRGEFHLHYRKKEIHRSTEKHRKTHP